ncbi:MAG: serpin family protein [Chloroflexi bacterium]|nr:serpin family protein [Chloroflexota bacterium]
MRQILIILILVVMVAAGVLPAIAHQEPIRASQRAQTGDLVTSNNEYAFDLYAALRSADENLIFSPYSISMALALVYAGAQGDTATQMAETLHFDMPRDDLNAAFFDLQNAFNAEIEIPEYANPSELNIVNGLWGQLGYPFRPEYLDLLQTQYEAGFAPVDFANEPEAARDLINGWISENSNERITEMLPEGYVSPMMRVILANVIFFKGIWLMEFPKDRTEDGQFTLLDGNDVTVPMMHQELITYPYLAGENYQAIELLFQDGTLENNSFEMAMLFVLPNEGAFEDVEALLDATWFNSTMESLDYTLMNLSMPKFSYESNLSLTPILSEMGMRDAFDPSLADFSGIVENPDESFYIDSVLHTANIDVNEIGTEASAATVIGMGGGGSQVEPIELTFNRSFIYAIYDRVSGSILFLGRVLNPAL